MASRPRSCAGSPPEREGGAGVRGEEACEGAELQDRVGQALARTEDLAAAEGAAFGREHRESRRVRLSDVDVPVLPVESPEPLQETFPEPVADAVGGGVP